MSSSLMNEHLAIAAAILPRGDTNYNASAVCQKKVETPFAKALARTKRTVSRSAWGDLKPQNLGTDLIDGDRETQQFF
jgi:hypothetical protein